MNYLFFDIECARCAKGGVGYICEFGYILCNEEFEEIEQNHFMINPKESFDKWALKNVLHYTQEEYEKCPTLPEHYVQIEEVLMREDQRVIGKNAKADFGYLASEAKRYQLPTINCDYFDIDIPFKILRNESNSTELKKMLEKLGIAPLEDAHNALIDAKMTMLVCKELCRQYKKTIEELLAVRDKASQNKKDQPKRAYVSIGEQLRAKGIESLE